MSDTWVEGRRIRTWVQEGQADEQRRWRLVAKAQFMRYRRSWVFWVLVASAVVLTVGNILGPFDGMQGDGGLGYWSIFSSFAMPATWLVGAALLLTAAPAIADDIRFDAPLFYFSRPLLVRDYLVGKLAFIVGLLLMLVLPAALAFTLASTATWGADGPTPPDPDQFVGFPQEYARELRWYEEELPDWRATHMDNFGDWALTTTVLWAGTLVSLVFLGALTLAISSYTTRGWHAAIALIVTVSALGMIGIAIGDLLTDGAAMLAFSPPAWPYAATMLPLEAYYQETPMADHGYYRSTAAATTVAFLGMIGSSIGLVALTDRRLRRLGGAL